MFLPTPPEPVLIQLLRQKDPDAFSFLYDKYHCALFGVIIRKVKDQQIAERILLETFLQAFRHFDKYDAKNGRIFTWLFVIAWKKSLNYLAHAVMVNHTNPSTSSSALTGFKSPDAEDDNQYFASQLRFA